MKNVFIFHGTEGHPNENWFPWAKQKLENQGFNVYIPQFPSPPIIPAKIDEWFEVFENLKDKIDENTIIIGHSLGGIFTLRVLEKLNLQIKGAIFVGTPIGIKPILYYDRDNSFSGFDFDWTTIKKNSKNFIVFHSDNDSYVCLKNGQKLAENLETDLTFVKGVGHFNKEFKEFQLLLDKIKSLER